MARHTFLKCSVCNKTFWFCKGVILNYDLKTNYIDFLQFCMKHFTKCQGNIELEEEGTCYCGIDIGFPSDRKDEDDDLNDWFFPCCDLEASTLQGKDEGKSEYVSEYQKTFLNKKRLHIEYIKKINGE